MREEDFVKKIEYYEKLGNKTKVKQFEITWEKFLELKKKIAEINARINARR